MASLVAQRHRPSLLPRCYETTVFGLITCLCQGPNGRRKQKAGWHISEWIHFNGVSHRGYGFPGLTVVDTVYSGRGVSLRGGRLCVKAVNIWAVSLGGFCIERAVRRETSDFCGTSCYQSDVRGMLFPDLVPISQVLLPRCGKRRRRHRKI